MHPLKELAHLLWNDGLILPELISGKSEERTRNGFFIRSLPRLVAYGASVGLEDLDKVIIEVVGVHKRNVEWSHYHLNTTEVILFLGSSTDGIKPPHHTSRYYLEDEDGVDGGWYPALPGTCVLIPPTVIHDFDPGRGVMYFLSIQRVENLGLVDPELGNTDFHNYWVKESANQKVDFKTWLKFFWNKVKFRLSRR